MITTLALWTGYVVLASFGGVVSVILYYIAEHQAHRLRTWWQARVWIELRDQPRSRFASSRKAEAVR